MRLVFAGTPEAGVASLDALFKVGRHEVVAVVTRPPSPAGRGRTITESPTASWAHEHDIEVLTPTHPGDAHFLQRLSQIAPECCPVVAYGALLPRAALDLAPHGWVNLHFSLLPAWRGAAPVQRALMAGDEVTGATTFEIVPELDAGPTYGVVTEAIRSDDTAGALLSRLAVHGAQLLVATLDGIEDGTLVPRPQPPQGISLAPKLTVDEARINWSQPAFAVDRHVRGCTPAPGAWTLLRGARLKVAPVRLIDGEQKLGPGEVQASRTRVLVGTGTDPVEVTHVQPAGKPTMQASDWLRGLRPAPDQLGS